MIQNLTFRHKYKLLVLNSDSDINSDLKRLSHPWDVRIRISDSRRDCHGTLIDLTVYKSEHNFTKNYVAILQKKIMSQFYKKKIMSQFYKKKLCHNFMIDIKKYFQLKNPNAFQFLTSQSFKTIWSSPIKKSFWDPNFA